MPLSADEAIKEMRDVAHGDVSLYNLYAHCLEWADAIEAELKALRADLRAYVLELGGVLRREAASEKVRREVAGQVPSMEKELRAMSELLYNARPDGMYGITPNTLEALADACSDIRAKLLEGLGEEKK